ncbi:small heat shock protein [Suillus paluster]|uniref:small heat shock protein n=1 Tax=Suillus paluster TaxID=48578 RepID=UPI001B877D12|nr:small heat shock protein [Suillus paluster]KAG1737085.1 small heat shock protein [Suillus paluster]
MSLSLMFCDPSTEFERLFDDAFDARFRPSPAKGNNTLTRRSNEMLPKMDLHENAETKTVTATFELPGLKPQDVNVDVHGNRLIISGESKRSENYDKGGYAVQERSHGKFSRTLLLPQGIKAEDIHAKMENGVLTVSFPNAGPDQQPQRVEIA